jgi:regulator of extracellular matrix RemA (YlzA/DUF370 family)
MSSHMSSLVSLQHMSSIVSPNSTSTRALTFENARRNGMGWSRAAPKSYTGTSRKCSDLAGRGLDISGVDVVLNFEVPRNLSEYVHRVGRTARAGRKGKAVTLADDSQVSFASVCRSLLLVSAGLFC